MNVAKDGLVGKTISGLHSRLEELTRFVSDSAEKGADLRGVEHRIFVDMLKLGHEVTEMFIALQGDGDLGAEVTTAAGTTLYRSESPHPRNLRTVFGMHEFSQFVYAPGSHRAIELKPLDARMGLSPRTYSYLMEEFAMLFCVETAFAPSATNLSTVFGGTFSVNTLERTCSVMGEHAEEYLDRLPTPASSKEGEVLVASADGKGVPMIRERVAPRPAMAECAKRPGNRKMATVAAVYSVDRHPRTPRDIVAALFRDDREGLKTSRPEPCFKHVMAHFTETYDEDYEFLETTGPQEAFAWMAPQIEERRQPGQQLVILLDGSATLWDQAKEYLPADAVPILDVLHAAQYVWKAAHALHPHNEPAEAFARSKLLSLLEGQAASVTRSLRYLATSRNLTGQKLATINTVCNYLNKHLQHMRYDEYLRAGYPIATGVIEGACRHLVKDRMERSGMRWTIEGAKAMLNARALRQSSYWEDFHETRRATEQKHLHTHRDLLIDYQPTQLAA